MMAVASVHQKVQEWAEEHEEKRPEAGPMRGRMIEQCEEDRPYHQEAEGHQPGADMAGTVRFLRSVH